MFTVVNHYHYTDSQPKQAKVLVYKFTKRS